MTTNGGRRVLVTGATGFIGRALCCKLAASDCFVHALSRGGQTVEGAPVSWAVDAADPNSLGRIIAEIQPELVYHLAAHVTGSREIDAVQSTLRGKLLSTLNVLEATHSLEDCRVILAGSMEEPEALPNAFPGSPYAAATAAATSYGEMFHRLYDRAVITARISMVYGPDDPNRHRVIPYVIDSILRGESPELSSGTRSVDWIYIDDVVRGLVQLGANETIRGNVVEFGTGRLRTVREIAERIAHAIAGNVELRFGALADRRFERVRAANLAATQARLDWRPEVPLDEGIARTIAAARKEMRD